MDRKPLRIGILTDGEYTPAWAYEMIRKVRDSGLATFEVLITNGAQDKPKTFVKKITSRLQYFTAVAYLTLEQKFLPGRPDAFGARSFEDLLPDVPRLEVKPRKTAFRDYIEGEDLEKVRSYDLDILLCRGFRILGGEILELPRFGVWSYHHGDNDVNRGRPAIFWETMQWWENVGVIFQVLKHELDNGQVIFKSQSGHRSRFVFRNMNSVYWKSASFFHRAVKYLHDEGEEAFQALLEKNSRDFSFYDRPLYKIPGNWEMIPLLFQHFLRLTWERIRERLVTEQWHLALQFTKKLGGSLFRYKRIPIPRDQFWADPFVITREKKHYIYFEKVRYGENKGNISLVEVTRKSDLSKLEPKVVLERPYHLSYPFLLEEGEELYMIPETAQNRTIELYRCVQFPDRFEPVMNLMEDVHAVDTTVLKHQGRYWLFCNMVENPGSSSYDELFLFSSECLETQDWEPHPMNPIVSDCRRARPAGAILEEDGKLFRPAQICTPKYGYGIVFHEITRLDRKVYEEVEVERILPLWEDELEGVHTFNRGRGVSVVDVAVRKVWPFS